MKASRYPHGSILIPWWNGLKFPSVATATIVRKIIPLPRFPADLGQQFIAGSTPRWILIVKETVLPIKRITQSNRMRFHPPFTVNIFHTVAHFVVAAHDESTLERSRRVEVARKRAGKYGYPKRNCSFRTPPCGRATSSFTTRERGIYIYRERENEKETWRERERETNFEMA